MVEEANLILLDVLTKIEYEIKDEIIKNPNLSDEEIKDLLFIVKNLFDEINSRILRTINKKEGC